MSLEAQVQQHALSGRSYEASPMFTSCGLDRLARQTLPRCRSRQHAVLYLGSGSLVCPLPIAENLLSGSEPGRLWGVALCRPRSLTTALEIEQPDSPTSFGGCLLSPQVRRVVMLLRVV